MNYNFIKNKIHTSVGEIPIVSTKLDFNDNIGTLMVRFSINRDSYKIEPGLYGVGFPNENSDVFVTGNYKLSFDILRESLDGLDAWILILDTKGINVWCAAGKGTFGSKELKEKIRFVKLDKIVTHRKIIVPQL